MFYGDIYPFSLFEPVAIAGGSCRVQRKGRHWGAVKVTSSRRDPLRGLLAAGRIWDFLVLYMWVYSICKWGIVCNTIFHIHIITIFHIHIIHGYSIFNMVIIHLLTAACRQKKPSFHFEVGRVHRKIKFDTELQHDKYDTYLLLYLSLSLYIYIHMYTLYVYVNICI